MFADFVAAAVVLPALSMQEAYKKLVDDTPAVPPEVAPLDVGAATFAVELFTVSAEVVTEDGVIAPEVAPDGSYTPAPIAVCTCAEVAAESAAVLFA